MSEQVFQLHMRLRDLVDENEKIREEQSRSYGASMQLMAENERLRAALQEIAQMDDPAISAQQVAADALGGQDE